MSLVRFVMVTASVLAVSFTAPRAMGQSAQQVVEAELNHAFGLFGPLAMNADGVTEQSAVVTLKNPRVAGVLLGSVSLQVRPVGDGVFEVSAVELPTDVSAADGSSLTAADWRFSGEWNNAIKGYQSLDYRISGLTIVTAAGGFYTADDIVMRADANGYSLRLSGFAATGGEAPAVEGQTDTRFALSVDNLIYDGRWTGSAAGAAYASLGRSLDLRFMEARRQGGEALLAATLAHLENLYLPASSSFTDLQASGLRLFFGPQDLEIALDSFSIPAASEGERLKSQTVNVVLNGLDIRRREDFAGLRTGSINIDLEGADVQGFSLALASLFRPADAGANWSILADMLLFFDSIGIKGSAEDLVFALPDRLFSLSMEKAQGVLGLTDMRLDGAFVTLRGQADGIDLSALKSPQGVEPDPIVIPQIVPVVGGRLVRFDPLSQSLVPNAFEGTLEVTGLPMANLRQTLASLPRDGSVQEPSVLMRSFLGGALGMITPFLIQPPRVSVTDTRATADDYTMTIAGEHQIMPIPPLFGFGSFTATVTGLDDVQARARATIDAALASNAEDEQGLADYGRQIAGWAGRLRDLGTASSATEQTYVLELTQFGEVELNGVPFNQ